MTGVDREVCFDVRVLLLLLFGRQICNDELLLYRHGRQVVCHKIKSSYSVHVYCRNLPNFLKPVKS